MKLHTMTNKYRKDTTVNISKSKKKELITHLAGRPNISYWIEGAIDDKIARESGTFNPAYKIRLNSTLSANELLDMEKNLASAKY